MQGYRQQQQAWTALSNAPPTSDQVTTPSTELEQPPSYHEPIPLSDTNATVPPPSHPRPPPSHLPPTFLRSHTDSSSSSSVQQPPSSQQDHSNIFTGTSQSYDDSERKGGEMNYRWDGGGLEDGDLEGGGATVAFVSLRGIGS